MYLKNLYFLVCLFISVQAEKFSPVVASYHDSLNVTSTYYKMPFPVIMLRKLPNKSQGGRWFHRLLSYSSFVKSPHPPNTILFLIDANDMMWNACPEGLIHRFLSFDANVVIGAEMGCSPSHLRPVCDKFANNPITHIPCTSTYVHCDPNSRTKNPGYKYPNGGFISGYLSSIRRMYDLFKKERWVHETVDDQEALIHLYKKWSVSQNWILDYGGKLVINLHCFLRSGFRKQNTSFYSLAHQSQPCFYHGNGNGKDWMKVLQLK